MRTSRSRTSSRPASGRSGAQRRRSAVWSYVERHAWEVLRPETRKVRADWERSQTPRPVRRVSRVCRSRSVTTIHQAQTPGTAEVQTGPRRKSAKNLGAGGFPGRGSLCTVSDPSQDRSGVFPHVVRAHLPFPPPQRLARTADRPRLRRRLQPRAVARAAVGRGHRADAAGRGHHGHDGGVRLGLLEISEGATTSAGSTGCSTCCTSMASPSTWRPRPRRRPPGSPTSTPSRCPSRARGDLGLGSREAFCPALRPTAPQPCGSPASSPRATATTRR